MDLVQFFKQYRAFANQRASEPDLRNRIAGVLEADRDGGCQEGRDEHPVLGNLRPRDALHSAQGGVHKNDRHADIHPDVHIHFQEAGEHDADAAHLAGDVSE